MPGCCVSAEYTMHKEYDQSDIIQIVEVDGATVQTAPEGLQ
jgi:hypothetical protein